MLWNRTRRVSRTQEYMWSTTQADPPTVQRAGELPERYAGTPSSAEIWRTLRNRFLCPLTCGCLEQGIAQWRTVLLPAGVAPQGALIRLGLPVRVGKDFPVRTPSLNLARSPSRWARPAGSAAKSSTPRRGHSTILVCSSTRVGRRTCRESPSTCIRRGQRRTAVYL